MKRKNCQGGRIGAFVMGFMHPSVNLWVMHQAVRPIEISVVEKNKDKQLQTTPNSAVGVEIRIEFHKTELIQQGDKCGQHPCQ